MIEEGKYKAIAPNQMIRMQAKQKYTEVYKQALKDGDIPRDALEDHLIKQGLLTEKDLQETKEVSAKIDSLLEPLKKGGIKLTEMVERAKEASNLRVELYSKQVNRSKYDNLTAENKAEDARFLYLVWACFRNADGSLVWPDYNSFSVSSDIDLIDHAIKEVNKALNPEDDNFDITQAFAETPENKFLIKHKIYDEKLKDITVKEETEPVFLDDDGNPIINE
jgi:hypothetical protein